MAEEAPGTPQPLWAVQWTGGGIPEEPHLFDNRDNARRYFVEVAVANGLEFTDDCDEGWIGNDKNEVRLFGPIEVWKNLAPPANSEWDAKADECRGGFVMRPFTAEENEKVESILATLKLERRAEQLARELLAEDSTPGRPGGCD